MDNWLPLARFLHVFAAIYWVGTVLFMALFMEPTVRAMGPAGGAFMQRLSGTRFSLSLSLAALVTVLAGLLMYGPVTNNAVDVMLNSRLPLTIGAICGLISAILGTFVSGRSSGRLTALGKEIAGQGGPPTPEQGAEMGRLQGRLRMGVRLTAVFMVLATLGMTWP